MKSSRNIIVSAEEKYNSEYEWEDKSKRADVGSFQGLPVQKSARSLFFEYNYDIEKEKKLKLLSGSSHRLQTKKKIASMIQEYWSKKNEIQCERKANVKLFLILAF